MGAEPRRRGLKGSRALACIWQAVLGLRWFRDRTTPEALARDHAISRATACRYRDEVIDVLAGQAPDLHQALQRAGEEGLPHVILDGTIIDAWANAGSPCSPGAGALCGTSPPALPGSQTSPGQPSS